MISMNLLLISVACILGYNQVIIVHLLELIELLSDIFLVVLKLVYLLIDDFLAQGEPVIILSLPVRAHTRNNFSNLRQRLLP